MLKWNVNYIFNVREQYFSSLQPIELNLIKGKFKRKLFKANYYAIRGDYKKSINFFLSILKEQPNERNANISLIYLLTALNKKEFFIEVIKVLERYEHLFKDNLYYAKSYCELLLQVDSSKKTKFIEIYIRSFLINEVICKLNKNLKPVLFWHIPKCAGTSFNSFIAKKFYKNGLQNFPSYNTPLLMDYILKNNDGRFPYLSSSHLGGAEIDKEYIKKNYFQVAVIREPRERSISSWRQYYQNPLSRLNIFPQHGSHWDYWPRASLGEWVERVPNKHVNYISYTFSDNKNNILEEEYFSTIDMLYDYNEITNCLYLFCEKYNLVFNSNMIPQKLNSTNKNILYSNEDFEKLEAAVQKDIGLYKSIKNK